MKDSEKPQVTQVRKKHADGITFKLAFRKATLQICEILRNNRDDMQKEKTRNQLTNTRGELAINRRSLPIIQVPGFRKNTG